MSEEGYKLVWHDEFNKTGKPDSTKWSYEQGFVRNEELQWYQPENASVKNGLLILEGRRERVENKEYDPTSSDWRKSRRYAHYTSGSVNTEGKYAFRYGIITVRARIDTAGGMWPAIWTVGEAPGRYWPAIGEIDIMEHYLVGGKSAILANFAWAGEGSQPVWDDIKIPLAHFTEQDSSWTDKFHIWKMKWSPDSIKLYLDDELLNDIGLDKVQNPDGFNPFRHPHVIRLNLALGSAGGDPSGTDFPRQYKIDYVRVYQQSDTTAS